jgi:hypothetical protein
LFDAKKERVVLLDCKCIFVQNLCEDVDAIVGVVLQVMD